MKVETALVAPTIDAIGDAARRIEDAGYDSVITPEAGHDPFLPLMIIAEHTKKLKFGTGVAIAFPRSPFVTAQIAWDLQRFSGGRFMLGLGTQVKGHNERRYSTAWPSPPGPRLREYILCLKAIFKTFQSGARPDYQGKHYQFTLISPFFSPGANENGHVPIYISAVNPLQLPPRRRAVRRHPHARLQHTKYTNEVIIPAIKEGAEKAGRKFEDIDIVGGAFVITGKNEEEVEKAKAPVRQQLSFYASTRVYHPVLEVHGWQDAGEQLFRLSMEGKWGEMANMITDEMLDEMAVIGTYDQIADKLKQRYAGVVTTLDFGFGVRTPEQHEALSAIVQELKKV